jgi:hypothetical protein
LTLLGVVLSGCPGSIDDPQPFREHIASTCPPDFDVERDLFRRTCGQLSCHTGGPQLSAAGLDLSAPGMGARLLTHVSGNEDCLARPLIDPTRSLEDSYLYEKLDEDQPSCGDRMPLGLPPLTRGERVCLDTYLRTLMGDGGVPMPLDGGPPVEPDAGPPPSLWVEAEAMQLDGYVVDPVNPDLIRLPDGVATGTATTTFDGPARTYRLRIVVVLEADGQPQIAVRVDGTVAGTFTYPLSEVDFQPTTLGPVDVSLRPGSVIALEGTVGGMAWARVDQIEVAP